MLDTVKSKCKVGGPSRELIVQATTVFAILVLMSFAGLGNDAEEELVSTLQSIGNFISLIILGVAVPNGAYGFLQYMTAGSNVDQDEKGRKRIRNTFIGLAGVAVIQVAVEVFDTFVSVTDDENGREDAFNTVADQAVEATVYAYDGAVSTLHVSSEVVVALV